MALDYLPSPSWAVIYGETPSADRWSELGENDDALATGAGIDDLAILTRHLAAQAVDYTKLSDSFVRSRRKNYTTNAAVAGYKIQHGWGFKQGNNTTLLTEAITYPEAFSAAPIVLLTFISAAATSGGVPDDPSDFSTGWADFKGILLDDGTASGGNVVIQGSAAASSSFYFGFNWLAIGPA